MKIKQNLVQNDIEGQKEILEEMDAQFIFEDTAKNNAVIINLGSSDNSKPEFDIWEVIDKTCFYYFHCAPIISLFLFKKIGWASLVFAIHSLCMAYHTFSGLLIGISDIVYNLFCRNRSFIGILVGFANSCVSIVQIRNFRKGCKDKQNNYKVLRGYDRKIAISFMLYLSIYTFFCMYNGIFAWGAAFYL
ncbi:hypothetical protein EDEG_01561 [Edhazardia aedis USNM 41457]|uniref:Uncharacterized protein n=1 Tax=Edhazardia aedis (strain USNM 41457) TaxID=1003232 RepID=J9DNL6_EDHAE|nr:hypothetical protein EDEG_01561 [Edhazardia aedis USNM 41457]|eukprot:EJW04125.1 hypothetical protein EDEG_01561 [Edhazardia aedis USNM 41457]